MPVEVVKHCVRCHNAYKDSDGTVCKIPHVYDPESYTSTYLGCEYSSICCDVTLEEETECIWTFPGGKWHFKGKHTRSKRAWLDGSSLAECKEKEGECIRKPLPIRKYEPVFDWEADLSDDEHNDDDDEQKNKGS